MYGYIYETTNLINGKKYIGQHRGKFNNNYKGSGKLIAKALSKYGADNFKVNVLCECNSLEELNEKEIYYIELFNADLDDNYYNIAKGGSNYRSFRGKNNPMYNKHHSKASIIKMSLSAKKSSWNKGTHGLYSKEYREKMSKAISKAKLGVKLSDSHRLAIKKAMRRPEVRAKLSKAASGKNNHNYGKHLSKETRAKISLGNKGKVLSEETKKRMSEATKKAMQRPEVREKISNALSGKKLSESHRLAISKAVKYRIRGENNPSYAYYKLIDNNNILYFSGKKSLVCYCNHYYNLTEPIVRALIKYRKPYEPSIYDIKHNRSIAEGIIIYKIDKKEYYERK